MYGRLLRYSLFCPLVLSGCALIGYDLDAVRGGPGGARDDAGTSSASDGGANGRRGRGPDSPTSGSGALDSGPNEQQAGSGARGAGMMPDGATPADAGVPPAGDAGIAVSCSGRSDGTPCEDGNFCTVDDRCDDDECQAGSTRDCSELDYTCNDGYCDEQLDACATKPEANGGVGDCVAGQYCVSGACAPGEDCMSGEDCDYTCPGGICNYDCIDANSCNIACDSGSDCFLISCWRSDCRVACAAGSSCVVNCTGAEDCSHIVCNEGAACALNCNQASNCGFEVCGAPGGEQSCSDNWRVCNHECP